MEKLRKCNSFSELKIGLITVVLNCDVCGKARCRGLLIEYVKHEVDINEPCYYTLPNCNTGVGGESCISPLDVASGSIYIVEDNLEDEAGVKDKKKITVKV